MRCAPPLLLRFVRFAECFQHGGQIDGDRRPKDVEIDVEVVVDQAVAGAGGSAPGDLGVLLPCLFGDELGRFADDLDQLREPEPKEFVGLQVVAAAALGRGNRPAGELTRWRSLTLSGGGIEGQRAGPDLVPEVAAQVVVGAEVNLPTPEQSGKLLFHAGDREQAGGCTGMELDEQINVALRPEIVPQGRAEQGEPPDMVTAAEGFQRRGVDVDVRPDPHAPSFSRSQGRGAPGSRGRDSQPIPKPAASGRSPSEASTPWPAISPVRAEGLEPSRTEVHRDLNPANAILSGQVENAAVPLTSTFIESLSA